MYKLLIISCVLFSGCVMGELIKFTKCPEQSALQCTVSNVAITPCPEAAEGQPCRVKKGRNVAIDFDITPEFPAETLHSQAYWAKGSVDLPLIPMENDGCKSTQCPIAIGATHSYHWSLDVDKKYPARPFPVKMKLTNEDGNFCCFQFNIKLTK